MKRFLFLALSVISSLSVYSYDFQIGNLRYSITSTSERTVSVEAGSSSLSGNVVIPSVVTYNDVDYTVNFIADRGFASCHDIKSFKIPNSVKGIGSLGFGWCWYLNTIILDSPNSRFSVGTDAFDYDWRDFKTVRIINVDEKELINDGAGILASSSLPTHDLYINGEKVIDYRVADGVETINNCFRNCNSIETLSMPNSVKYIISSACYGCTALKTITLSSKLESIGYNAFNNCPELRTIYAKSTTPPSIGASTFPKGAFMFATVYIPKGTLSTYKNANVWSNFANIVETDYDNIPDVPQPSKCSIPIINYSNGKLIFSCETQDVEYVYNIIPPSAKSGSGTDITMPTKYTISVYATKDGYENSDVATKDINVVGGASGLRGDVNEDGEVNVGDMVVISNIMSGNE